MTHALSLSLPSPAADLGGYFHAIQQFPMLSEADEQRLATELRAEKNLEAAWQLVTSHLRFVAKLARGYRGYGLPEEDLIQEGNVGLMKAVKRFDPEFGVRLAAFAVHWIRAEIHEFVLRNWRIVKVATTKAQRKLFFNLRSAKKALAGLSLDEAQSIADDLNVKVGDVLEMESRLETTDSPYETTDAEEGWVPAHYLSESTPGPEASVLEAEYASRAREEISSALERLDERAREIVTRRWLIEPKAPLRELAEQFGVSMERIRQIEADAMATLREAVALRVGTL